MTPPRLVGVLLAAGASVRFGAEKLLAPIPMGTATSAPGTPVALAAYRHLAAVLPDCVAVVRPGASALRELLVRAGARVVECARAHEGMGASVACGVAASSEADGWVIALADMPWIRPDTIARIAAAVERADRIVAPQYAGRRGHPVAFGKDYRDALMALGGDAGARAVLAAHPEEVVCVAVEDAAVLRDVDVPQDLV